MPASASPQHYFSRIVEISGRFQRQIVLLLGTLSLAYHIVLYFLPPPYDPVVFHWGLGMGLALSVLVLLLIWFKAPAQQTHIVILSIIASWMTVDMLVGVRAHQGVTMWMVLDLMLATLMVLAFLPAERGLWGVVVLYVIFAVIAALAGPLDWVLLLNLLMLMIFAAYLALDGATVSGERAQKDRLLQELRYDGLTGALTRQAIEGELDRLLTLKKQTGKDALLLLIDLDHFKQVNDRYGHLTGDRVLQRVTQALQNELGSSGYIGRWGGEEFMALVPVGSVTQGQTTAERLRRRVSELHQRPQSEVQILPPLTISLGGVMLRPDVPANQLIEEADVLLYAAKTSGRNCALLSGKK